MVFESHTEEGGGGSGGDDLCGGGAEAGSKLWLPTEGRTVTEDLGRAAHLIAAQEALRNGTSGQQEAPGQEEQAAGRAPNEAPSLPVEAAVGPGAPKDASQPMLDAAQLEATLLSAAGSSPDPESPAGRQPSGKCEAARGKQRQGAAAARTAGPAGALALPGAGALRSHVAEAVVVLLDVSASMLDRAFATAPLPSPGGGPGGGPGGSGGVAGSTKTLFIGFGARGCLRRRPEEVVREVSLAVERATSRPPADVRIHRHRETGQAKGSAHVRFRTAQDAEQALAALTRKGGGGGGKSGGKGGGGGGQGEGGKEEKPALIFGQAIHSCARAEEWGGPKGSSGGKGKGSSGAFGLDQGQTRLAMAKLALALFAQVPPATL